MVGPSSPAGGWHRRRLFQAWSHEWRSGAAEFRPRVLESLGSEEALVEDIDEVLHDRLAPRLCEGDEADPHAQRETDPHQERSSGKRLPLSIGCYWIRLGETPTGLAELLAFAETEGRRGSDSVHQGVTVPDGVAETVPGALGRRETRTVL